MIDTVVRLQERLRKALNPGLIVLVLLLSGVFSMASQAGGSGQEPLGDTDISDIGMVQVPASDLAASDEFFSDKLGFSAYQHSESSRLYRFASGQTFQLIAGDSGQVPNIPGPVIGLAVGNLDKAERYYGAKGVEFFSPGRDGDRAWTYFRLTEGYPFMLVSQPGATPVSQADSLVKGIIFGATFHDDFGKAGTFLAERFGLEVYELPPEAQANLEVFLLPSGNLFEVKGKYAIFPEAARIAYEKQNRNYALVGFRVDDVVKTRALLEQRGVEMLSPVWDTPQMAWFYIAGPDGFMYEIAEIRQL